MGEEVGDGKNPERRSSVEVGKRWEEAEIGKRRKMGKRGKMAGGLEGDEVRDENVGEGLEKGHKRWRYQRAEDKAEIDPIEERTALTGASQRRIFSRSRRQTICLFTMRDGTLLTRG